MAPDLGPAGPSAQRYGSLRPDSLLDVDEARRRIVAAVGPLKAVTVPILDALGLVLAESVRAEQNVPSFRNSAMDGYAVRHADTTLADPVRPARLTVVGEVAAGQVPDCSVGAGQAVRIMTGAMLPEGADAVVRFEETDEWERGARRSTVLVRREARAWDNVREAGEDVSAGDIVLPEGTFLHAAAIGVLASLGRRSVAVHRKPRIGVLSTGHELVELGSALAPGKIRDSNGPMLVALVREAGAEPVSLGVAGDCIDAIRAKLARLAGIDLLLISGGVSQGDFDLVKDVLHRDGAVDFWQVRIKPGKPLAFGRLGAVPMLGLPGNPAAAFVAFLEFGVPAIRAMQGRVDLTLPTLRARLLERLENRGGRRHFIRGRLERAGEEYVVRPSGSQGAGMLTSAARSNCLIVLPETVEVAAADEMVDVQILLGESIA